MERVRETPQDQKVKRKNRPPNCGCWSLADARSNERATLAVNFNEYSGDGVIGRDSYPKAFVCWVRNAFRYESRQNLGKLMVYSSGVA